MTQTAGVEHQAAGHGAEPQEIGRSFWQRYFTFYDALNEAIPYRQMVSRHVEWLAPRPGEEILDAGTGTGNVALALLARGARVTGIDYVEAALEICRAKAPAATFEIGDLTRRLAFEDGRFDKLACCNVIYTLAPEDQPNAVRELYRVVKPGGLAVITVFGAGFRALRVYRETLRLEARERGLWGALRFGIRYALVTVRILYYVSKIKRQQRSGGYTFFTPEQFRRLLEDGGFRVERLEPVFASQCLIALAVKPASKAGRNAASPAEGTAA